VILADMNATTDLALKKSRFDGSNINSNYIDHISNDNGERLINYCKTNGLCISNTFFKHPNIHRYSWYSGTRIRKVLDYILAEKHLQECMTDCRIRRGYDFNTDHKLLVATLRTPCNKAARYKHRKTPLPSTKKVDLDMLLIPKIQDKYTKCVNSELELTSTQTTVQDMSDHLIKNLKEISEKLLPQKNQKQNKHDALYKNDTELNTLLDQRAHSHWPRNSKEYQKLTKKIKKRITYLKNERLKLEAESINQFAAKREIEDLFRAAKDNTIFKKTKTTIKCSPTKLTTFFKDHFNPVVPTCEPMELSHYPSFITELQKITDDIVINN